MSSGTMGNVAAARQMLFDGGLAKQAAPDASSGAHAEMSDWMSPRQMWLNWLWGKYRCEQYDHYRLDWSGQENLGKQEHDFVATSGFLPAGFYDAGQTLPLKFRKPVAPIHLVPVIVHRFTSLLFSSARSPKVTCPEDPLTTDWVNAAIESGRLWSHFIQARNYGGSMGSVGIGFKFVKGRLQFEIFDPRFCTPEFSDKSTGELYSIERRFVYTDHIRDPKTGRWVEAQFWYRRVIDGDSDQVWEKVPLYDGAEPDWESETHSTVPHPFKECPVQWIQNKPIQDETDGDPDCHGVYDLCWAIDSLFSQAHTGTLKNCDPTVHIGSDDDSFEGLAKGSNNAVKTEKGGTMEFVEMDGAGIKVAMDLAEKLEERVQLIARCYFDKQGGEAAKTATEVERDYSSMIEEADIRREQYGEHGIKPLLEKLIRAAKTLGMATIDRSNPATPMITRRQIILPKKPIINPDTGEITGLEERKLGSGETITLQWPPYFMPSLQDATLAVKAAGDAKLSGLIDAEHATQSVAPYFQVENIPEMLKRVKAEAATTQQELENKMMSKISQRGGGGRGFGGGQ
jgi:hypothetical protein